MLPSNDRPASEIDAEAARWAARIDGRRGEPLPELEAWLAADPRRSGALLRAQAILHLMGTPAEPVHEPQAAKPATGAARRWLFAAAGTIAAAVALMIAIPAADPVYETGPGEIQQVALDDGSAVAIDARSRVEIAYDAAARRIVMTGGRAIFRAAKGDPRPFTVEVGKVTITDIGTEFQVFDNPARQTIEVLVTEGEIRIEGPGLRRNVVAGQRIAIGRTASEPGRAAEDRLSTAEMLRTTAWREGRLELEGNTLAEAIAELNRANQVQIELVDAGLAHKELHGSFRITDPRGFAQAVAVSLDTRVSEQGGRIVIGS